MKYLLLGLIAGVMVVGTAGAGYNYLHASKGDASDKYRTMVVRRGDITSMVNSTGTVQPIHSVQVGSFVSGPIHKVFVDFNDKVTAGQILAEVDPLIYTAQRDQASALLDRAAADLLQSEAKLEQAKREWMRADNLRTMKAISDTDCDLAKATYETTKANVAICKATIKQNKAALELAETNLGYTTIKSPVEGIITDRKVDSGQTLASQFQTPVLFVVAPDLEKKVNVLASVDEADIGMIRGAQSRGEPVTFRVDAYPNDVFKGTIAQVRLTPTTVQNVVTYTVVVESPNEQLKLLPGMTVNLSFRIEQHKGVQKIPNAALRFYPKPDQVRICDRSILEGVSPDGQTKQDSDTAEMAETSNDPAPSEHGPKSRYVWFVDGELLAAVKVTTGLTDRSYAELVSGELSDGQALVTGMKTP
jgi:HlyD family secretion protein